MTALDDVLAKARPVDRADLYDAMAEADWRVPRYFQSPSVLTTGGYLQTHLAGCYVVLKWRAFYREVQAYAILPPVSLRGDVQDERAAVQLLQAAGFGLRGTLVDLARLGVDTLRTPARSVGGEYIYRLGDLADLTGRRWKHVRHQRNRAHALGITGTATRAAKPPADVVQLARDWATDRARGGHTWQALARLPYDPYRVVSVLRTPDQAPLAYSVADLTPQGVVGAWGARSYRHDDVDDPAAVMWHMEAVMLMRGLLLPGSTWLNVGIARDPGQATFKARMHPVDQLQLWHVDGLVKLRGTDYRPVVAPDPQGSLGLVP